MQARGIRRLDSSQPQQRRTSPRTERAVQLPSVLGLRTSERKEGGNRLDRGWSGAVASVADRRRGPTGGSEGPAALRSAVCVMSAPWGPRGDMGMAGPPFFGLCGGELMLLVH